MTIFPCEGGHCTVFAFPVIAPFRRQSETSVRGTGGPRGKSLPRDQDPHQGAQVEAESTQRQRVAEEHVEPQIMRQHRPAVRNHQQDAADDRRDA